MKKTLRWSANTQAKPISWGETVTVRVTGANRYAGTVDFELEEAEKRGNDGKISTETGREQ